MAYVYAHKKLNDNTIFYIGISKDLLYKRAHSCSGRNKLWHKIRNKYGFYVNILIDNITYDKAKELESYYISKLGRIDLKNGILCNMTNGGEGKVSYVTSQETRDKMRKAKTGIKMPDKIKNQISISKQKIIVNLCNGIFYDSAQQAAYYNSININTLYSNLSKKRNNNSKFIYI